MGHFIALFFGGAFVANMLPHLLAGIQGRLFPSPFASPPGRGMSPPVVNVLWGSVNGVAGWALLCPVGALDPGALADLAVAGLGGFLMALMLAWHFGRVMAEAGRA